MNNPAVTFAEHPVLDPYDQDSLDAYYRDMAKVGKTLDERSGGYAGDQQE